MHVVKINNLEEAVTIFRKIGVDPYGIGSMAAKTVNVNILLEHQSCKIANIIKQEMLSVGGDAAVARGSVDCSVPFSDILIMGTVKQILAMLKKIEKQPFGLNIIAANILKLLTNINQSKYTLKTNKRDIQLGERTLIMGILNVTPDSFSDGGLFYSQKKAIEHGIQMVEEGADIIDVGGESSRPGADSVSIEIELKRVIPVIKGLAKVIKIPISVDTTKAQVARQAVENGAEIVNDISALRNDKKMVKTIKDTGVAAILMHMRGKPRNMQKGNLVYNNLMAEIMDYLKKSIEKALEEGIEKDHLVVDPGIGFGKTPEDNYKIIKNLSQLKGLGMPIMLGTSRKSFIGMITGGEPKERVEGTAATVAAAILNGCNIVRVHDVMAMKKVAAVTDAIVRTN